jgi:RNA polymerase sigma factor (sigma-70 family)
VSRNGPSHLRDGIEPGGNYKKVITLSSVGVAIMSSSALGAGIRRLRGLVAGQRGMDESDERLLYAFTAHRDENAFAVLVRRHGPMVLGVCRRVLGHQQDAEDAFQATFLVLARGAAALRRKTALASFLHGTAHRIALSAKRAAARRRKYEAQAPARTPENPSGELLWREVQALLDEEIVCLPDAYRSVFVLCCLENLSRAEAARRLGLKEGTVSSRLAEARKRLQQRLSRRGVELTALLAATALVTPPASALPAVLLTAAKTTTISPVVAALMNAGLEGLSVSKMKLATAILLIGSLLTGASLWAYYTSADQLSSGLPEGPPAAKAENKPRTAPPKHEAPETVEVQGRVLGPDGKPKAGAKLLWLSEDEKVSQLGTSAADGRFTLAVPKKTTNRHRIDYLVARYDGEGVDFLHSGNLKPGQPVELRLVKDHVIRGRIVNTEGKPVAGARVVVRSIRVYANNSLDSFLIAWAKRQGNSEMPDGVKRFWPEGLVPFAATTDGDGCFALRGIGAERVVLLLLSGPGIASTERWVVNREGFDAQPFNRELRDNVPQREFWGAWTMMSGPDLAVVAESEKIIRGVVKDAGTGKGVAGATIWLTASGDREDSFFGLLALPLKTRTDAEGRYEMRGARKLKSYMFQVTKDPAAGYLGSNVRIDNTSGYQPMTADLTVKKGVIVTGKMIDKASGKSVPGYVQTAVLNGNPFAKEYSINNEYPRIVSPAETGSDGTFRDVVIPGPVLLWATVSLSRLPGGEAEYLSYKPARPDPKYPQYFQARPDDTYYTYYLGLNGVPGTFFGNFCKVLDAKPGTAVIHQDLFVERDSARTVKIQDAEGRPLARVWAVGLRPDRNSLVRLKGDSCPVYALEAGKSRLMVFYERGRKLAGMLRLTANEKEPFVAKLGSAGAIRGRLLDADGKPLAGVVVDVRYQDREVEEIHKIIHEAKQAVTDAAGAFALDELIPGLKFTLSFRRGKQRFEREAKPAEAAVQVKPDQSRDLGEIKLKLIPEKSGE